MTRLLGALILYLRTIAMLIYGLFLTPVIVYETLRKEGLAAAFAELMVGTGYQVFFLLAFLSPLIFAWLILRSLFSN